MGQGLVSVIVFLASAYAAWTVMPQALRKRIATAVIAVFRWAGWKGSGAVRLAERITERITASGGCSGCESCKGCETTRSAH